MDVNNGWAVGGDWNGTDYVSIILRTSDSGTTWITQSGGTTSTLYSVSFTDVNNGWAVGNSGKILRTTNGGSNWTSQSSGTLAYLWAVHFTDLNTGIVVGEGVILKQQQWFELGINRRKRK